MSYKTLRCGQCRGIFHANVYSFTRSVPCPHCERKARADWPGSGAVHIEAACLVNVADYTMQDYSPPSPSFSSGGGGDYGGGGSSGSFE